MEPKSYSSKGIGNVKATRSKKEVLLLGDSHLQRLSDCNLLPVSIAAKGLRGLRSNQIISHHKQIINSELLIHSVSAACLILFRSYLSQRSQQTSVGDALSSKRNIAIGAPQQSVLGPLLLLVFIYDLLLSVKYSKTILFADNTAIYYSGKNSTEIQNKMKEDLVLVKKWLNDHRLTLNITKSKSVVVGGKQQLKRFQAVIEN